MMTDRIGPLNPPPPGNQPNPRRAEENDTRQDIVRHDPDFFKKERGDDDQPGFRDPYEDLTDVSVVALRAFLIDLLAKAGMPLGQEAAPPPQTAEPVIPPTAPQPVSPQAAAINAYRHGAQAASPAGPVPPLPPQASLPEEEAEAAPATALDQAAAALDKAELLALIRALDQLYARGVTSISLEKGDGFLASIRVAVDKAMAG